jgi:DNA helicase-2/ATP-dependent DNA helicase PcrA
LAFPRVFPETTTIALEQNYRSTATILDAANEVIQNNPGRPEKNLWTSTAGGARIVVHTAANGFAEAAWVAEEVGELRARGVRGPDIAVLCRGKMTGRGVEEALLAAGIPCVFSGAVPFFERTHIKDLLAYLRLVVNRADELAFRRIVNTPRRSVGPASIRKLRTWARYRDLDIDAAMERCDEVDELPAKAKEGLLKLREVLETARAQSASGVGPDEVLADIIDATGYLAYVAQNAKGSTESALEAVERLLAIAGGHPSVLSLLEIAGLASQWEQDAEPDATDERVVIMTIHGAKGLEWPVVFVPAMEEGVFPDARCTSGPELEEERRLAYVAITRAQQRLYLSHAQSRMRFGYNERNEPSRFLGEIPEHLVSVSRR